MDVLLRRAKAALSGVTWQMNAMFCCAVLLCCSVLLFCCSALLLRLQKAEPDNSPSWAGALVSAWTRVGAHARFGPSHLPFPPHQDKTALYQIERNGGQQGKENPHSESRANQKSARHQIRQKSETRNSPPPTQPSTGNKKVFTSIDLITQTSLSDFLPSASE
jgi:hypothetical protein